MNLKLNKRKKCSEFNNKSKRCNNPHSNECDLICAPEGCFLSRTQQIKFFGKKSVNSYEKNIGMKIPEDGW